MHGLMRSEIEERYYGGRDGKTVVKQGRREKSEKRLFGPEGVRNCGGGFLAGGRSSFFG